MSRADGTESRSADWPRVTAYLAVGVFVPWTVVVYPGGFDLVFAWGLANTDPVHAVPLTDYLLVHTTGFRSLPSYLRAWPVGTVMFCLALASAAGGVAVGREDRRVTAGLLLFAAVSHLQTTAGLSRSGLTVLPLGPALLFVVVWWFHADDLRAMVPGGGG